MRFDTPMELAEHLYNESVESDMPTSERTEIAAHATRFALQKFMEQKEE